MEVPIVSISDLVDESGRPFFEREVAFERAFLQMRAATAARQALDNLSGEPGAPVIYPVTIFGPFEKGSGCGPAGQRPLVMSHEPGSVFPKGVTRVDWSVSIQGWKFEGYFSVAVGVRIPKDGDGCSVRSGRKVIDIPSPIPSVSTRVLRGAALKRALLDLTTKTSEAQAKVLALSEGLLNRALQRFSPRLTSSNLDWDDLMQIAKMKTLDMATRYASSDRPHASWGRVVGLGVDKAVQRALNKDAGIGRPEESVRRLFRERPELQNASVDEVRYALLGQIAEAETWSDSRILQAMHGAPRIGALPADDIFTEDAAAVADIASTTSMVDLLSDLIPSLEDRQAVAPFLVAEGLIGGDPKAYTNSQVGRAKKTLMEILKERLGEEGGSEYQLLASAFLENDSESSQARAVK